ncbi:GNAT family N-acetyltransferase [Sphingomonas jatrophae]|uniref:Ribosomal-protein-alanine N-acetyltransferase n=1 Tax=Sphingomonas jatrophae TaxID=1166337 RepID=A0A1I6M9C1_9SPHN|nr:GNAT family N-acetyltransferase [Sphingomonas jatrophae]SFS12289.1 ribosomal-protein-alanine N-acetyltransferase [Sphingomonas jatrophae]
MTAPAAELILRPGDGRDLDEVMAVMDNAFDPAFGEAWTRAQAQGVIGLTGVWLTLARHGIAPAGFALSRVVADEAELLLLAVPGSARRRGTGAALLAKTMEGARARGAATLHLEVRENNPALELYRHAGFVQVGRRARYYRGQDGRSYDALTLSLSLRPEVACK